MSNLDRKQQKCRVWSDSGGRLIGTKGCCDSAIVERRGIGERESGAGVERTATGWEIAVFCNAAMVDFILKDRRNITLDDLSNIHSVMRIPAMILRCSNSLPAGQMCIEELREGHKVVARSSPCRVAREKCVRLIGI